jgi:excinuclease ABC subunit B
MLRESASARASRTTAAVLSGRAPGSTPTTLLDYFPEDFLLFMDESHVMLPQLRGMYNGDRARKKTLVDYGFRLPSASTTGRSSLRSFEGKIHQVVFVSATPGEYEREQRRRSPSRSSAPPACWTRQVEVQADVEGQIDDLLGEINGAHGPRRARAGDDADQAHGRGPDRAISRKRASRCKYMHHEVDTFERMEIIATCASALSMWWWASTCCARAWTCPRSRWWRSSMPTRKASCAAKRALIQTIGRAARNAGGMVIMYADELTPSMERAIRETERRRTIQQAYNEAHGIVPKTIIKEIRESLEISDKAETARLNTRRMGKMERQAEIERLTKEMKQAAKVLEFEQAAFLRDQIERLEKGENPTTDSAAEQQRRQQGGRPQKNKKGKYFGKR